MQFNCYTLYCKVLQGAIIALLLFLIFINDLPLDLNSKSKLFADDTSVYACVPYVSSPNDEMGHLPDVEMPNVENSIPAYCRKTQFQKNTMNETELSK